jgi:hypothetical protein
VVVDETSCDHCESVHVHDHVSVHDHVATECKAGLIGPVDVDVVVNGVARRDSTTTTTTTTTTSTFTLTKKNI